MHVPHVFKLQKHVEDTQIADVDKVEDHAGDAMPYGDLCSDGIRPILHEHATVLTYYQ